MHTLISNSPENQISSILKTLLNGHENIGNCGIMDAIDHNDIAVRTHPLNHGHESQFPTRLWYHELIC